MPSPVLPDPDLPGDATQAWLDRIEADLLAARARVAAQRHALAEALRERGLDSPEAIARAWQAMDASEREGYERQRATTPAQPALPPGPASRRAMGRSV